MFRKMEATVICVKEGTVKQVIVRCPFCFGKHTHGIGTWKGAHCGKGEYKIQEKTNIKIEPEIFSKKG